MSLKTHIFIVLSFLLFTTTGKAQTTSNKDQKSVDTDTENGISLPDDFDNSLEMLTRSWIVQHATRSNCQSSENIEGNDSIYKSRLSKMPCVLEMPYNPVVKSYIDMYSMTRRNQVEFMLGLSQYYFPIFEQALSTQNLPLELKYLTIIESALNTTAMSRVGALGLWQLMIGTGRLYGLEINSLVDERMEPYKASNAAVLYLKDLYSVYGDWHLVIAAYNCGPNNINKAMRRAGGKRDYWTIYPYLPRETRGYVPVFIAANYIMNFSKDHNICPASVNIPSMTDTVMVHQRLHLEQIAAVLNLPLEEIKFLNPQYKKEIVPGDIHPYSVRLPSTYSNIFEQHLPEIAAWKADSLINTRREEIVIPQAAPVSIGGKGHAVYHKVRKGQTLSDIAEKYGVGVSQIKKWNHLRKSRINPGQRLKIIK
jgi:membrane-bound lytic murein transglycosylase D